jgi:hypothetical protein
MSAAKRKWRKCMGIEPTDRTLYVRSNGFEDREGHQPAKHFHAAFPVFLNPFVQPLCLAVVQPGARLRPAGVGSTGTLKANPHAYQCTPKKRSRKR